MVSAGGVLPRRQSEEREYIRGTEILSWTPYSDTSYLIIISSSILRRGLFAVRVSSRSRRVRRTSTSTTATTLLLCRQGAYRRTVRCGSEGTEFGMVCSQCKHGVSCILEGQLVSLREYSGIGVRSTECSVDRFFCTEYSGAQDVFQNGPILEQFSKKVKKRQSWRASPEEGSSLLVDDHDITRFGKAPPVEPVSYLLRIEIKIGE